MKETKLISIFLILSLFYVNSLAGQIRELKIGDTVPDLEFTTILNYSGARAKLSDFKGKLVILDFWSTSCGPCIAAMPKMDSLQKHFGNKIRILPAVPLRHMTSTYAGYIDSFWRSNKYTSKTDLPTVIDTNLYKYFPHDGVPYEVWIDSNMILRGLTLADYVNKKEIASLLSGENPDWEIAYKKYHNFKNSLQSVYNPDKQFEQSRSSHSVFMKYLKRVNSGKAVITDTVLKSFRFSAINSPILTLYSQLLRHNDSVAHKWGDNRIILETTDSSKYINIKKEYQNEWLKKNSYCYELSMPSPVKPDYFYEYMRQDLNRYLKLNGRSEKRLTNCLALIRINNVSNRPSNTSAPRGDIKASYASFIEETVTDINELIIKLNSEKRNPPVIDETNYAKGISFTFHLDPQLSFKDIPAIRKALRSKGFDLVPCKREIEMFVISETN